MSESKIVYILGAGSSKPDGIPLMKEFIAEGVVHLVDDIELINGFFKSVELAFPGQFRGGDKDKLACDLDNSVGIEQVLTKAMETNDSDAEDIIKEFIFKTIQETDSSSKRCFFRKFVQNRIECDIKGGNIVTIISFNYDQLLERTLLVTNLSKDFSFRIPSEIKVNKVNFDSYMQNYDGTLNILKLHGSFNWLFCDRCNRIELHWYKKYENKGICKSCSKRELVPILIPPTNDKSPIFQKYNNLFRQLWKEAEDALTNANETVVAGYSFRKEDTQARKTIGNGIANNSNAKLTIVDTHPDQIRCVLSEISGKEITNFTSSCSFQEFVNNSEAKNLR